MGLQLKLIGAALAVGLAGATPAAAEISFVAPVTFPAPDAERLAVGDFEKDGLLDVASANTLAGSVSLFHGDGGGGLGTAATTGVSGQPADIETADFNNDTNLAVAAAGQSSNAVTILPGAGNGLLGAPSDVPVGANANRLEVADLNGDNNVDLVVGEGGGSAKVDVLLGDGAGGFGAPTKYSVFAQPADMLIAF